MTENWRETASVFTTDSKSNIQLTRSITPAEGHVLEGGGITKIEYTEVGGLAVHLLPWGYLRAIRVVDGDDLMPEAKK